MKVMIAMYQEARAQVSPGLAVRIFLFIASEKNMWMDIKINIGSGRLSVLAIVIYLFIS